MAHAAYEIAVGCRNAALLRRENAHVAAQAGPARRRRDNASRLREYLQEALVQRLKPYLLCGGNHDGANAVGDLASPHHFRGDAHIRYPPVRAGADHHLVDGDTSGVAHEMRVGRQMRKRHRRLQLGEVDFHGTRVLRVRVGRVDARWLRAMFAQIGQRLFVDREDSVFRPRLNRHVGDGEAIVHGKFRHAVAREFERLVARAVHADHSDEMQDHVLATDPSARFAAQDDLDCGWDAEPRLSRRHTRRHVRGADAGGERAKRTIRAGVGIRADHKIAGRDQSLFRQKRVFDSAAVPHFEVVDDPLCLRERPHRGALRGGLDVLVGREVVWDERHLFAVEHAFATELREFPDGDRRCDVVAENEIELRHDQFAGMEIRRARRARPTSGVRGKDLLRHCHLHFRASIIRFTATSSASIEPSITSVDTPRPR